MKASKDGEATELKSGKEPEESLINDKTQGRVGEGNNRENSC